jgi:hypothetical protein
MSVTPSPIGGFAAQFFDNNGVILSGGKIFTYAAGTTTPQTTYTSASGTTPHANPIVLDSAGRVPGGEIWLTDSLVYKFVIETATGILLGTYDNITGVNSNFVNYTVQEEIQTATAGQTVFTLTTMTYAPGTNSLTVYIDGVNQYVGDSYIETASDTVTFTSGVHVGGEVKFTTAVQTNTGSIDASAVSYDPPYTNSVITNVENKLAQYVSAKDFGASPSNTEVQNKAALQDAISALNAQAGGTVTVSSDINYGYDVTDKTTWPDFTGVTKPIIVEDASIGNSYGTYPTTYDGCQVRTFMFTPQTSPTAGLHDGNTLWLRADWAPNYCISNDADLTGVRTADDNRRASYTIFNEGEATWRMGQGAISGAIYTSEELSNFIIEKYAAAGDTLGAYNTMLVERKTGNVGFGLATNSPSDSYVFKSVSSGFYQGVFESLGNTSYVILRTSAGIGEDAGIRNVAGDLSIWVPSQGDALTVNNTDRRISIGQSLVQKRVAQSYSASMALNTAFGNWFTIPVNNGTAITMAAPVNVADGQQITITFSNISGGAMGTVTWNAAFKLAAWTNPANGFNRSITFAYNGGNWIEVSRTTADVPN